MKAKDYKTLQANILQRALGNEEFEALIEKYRNSSVRYSSNRIDRFNKPITTRDKAVLNDYLFNNEIPLSGIEKKHKLGRGCLYFHACIVASKILFQNRALLNLEELLKGGENT
jgi:hypothetical protein